MSLSYINAGASLLHRFLLIYILGSTQSLTRYLIMEIGLE